MDRDTAERDALRRQVDDAVLVLFALVADGLGWATDALLNQDVDLAGRVIADDDGIDARCEALIALVKEGLSSEVLSPDELEHLIAVLQIVPELERSADLVEHIAQRATRGLGGIVTPKARGVIQGMCDVAVRMWHDCSVAYRQRSRDASFELSSMDDELDDLASRLIDAIVVEGTDPQVAADVALVARFYERIGDHAVNLARRVDMLSAPRRLESRKPGGSRRVIVTKEPKRKRGYVSRVMRKVGNLKLAPTDEGFFDLFENAAENARECAENLRKSLDSSANLEDCFEAIKRCESRGDELTREILGRLDASFVTPYDREDIHSLAEELDDVVDDIFEAASLIQLVGIDEQPAELHELTDVLVTMTGEMVSLIGSMKKGDGARHRLERIDYLERQGDAIFRRSMGELFNGGYDALYVIKWKDIVEAIENALNEIENVSDVVESILVKGG